ncbi:MAG TPA: hypothetical protein VGE65_03515 [Sphingobium sp.]
MIESAAKRLGFKSVQHEVKTWPQVFQPGEFIDTNILGAIDEAELCYFDITFSNFNVFFEAGYSIGRAKPTICTSNHSFEAPSAYLAEIGLFDTLAIANYDSSESLLDLLSKDLPPKPILPPSYEANLGQPLYLIKTRAGIEGMARVVSSLTDTLTQFRSYDPAEDQRMSLRNVVEHVATSTGVLAAVIHRQLIDATNHNLRAAFVAGLARGMDRELLLLNMTGEKLPLDVRDFTKPATDMDVIQRNVQTFALRSLARLQRASPQPTRLKSEGIQSISLGNTAAENETRRLSDYFVATPAYRAAVAGQGRVLIGRKGSGKTAIFTEMAKELGKGRGSLILPLQPEGYQLRKFKDNLVDFLNEGTKEHTVGAFWEYLLLLEICHRCIVSDAEYLGRDPQISRLLPQLRDRYGRDDYVIEGDFSERILLLLQEIERRKSAISRGTTGKGYLSRAEITELIYSHDINQLRADVIEYLATKKRVVILIDNLDKGWDAQGVTSDDLLMLRTLIEVGRKLERALAKKDVASFSLIFLRNDIYELLLDQTPDRGKEGKIAIDWTDRDLLKQVLRNRLNVSGDASSNWSKIAVSEMNGKGSLDWVIDRCLMRPRYLIDLVNRCLGSAASHGHNRIDATDFDRGYRAFSYDALVGTNLEIRDVAPECFDAIFALQKKNCRTSRIDISLSFLARGFREEDHDKILDLLVWYGVLGIVDEEGNATYIYEVEYNSHVIEKKRSNRGRDTEYFEINRAFWPALDISDADIDQMPGLKPFQ